MAWQEEHMFRLCGLCSMPAARHRITKHPVGWVALCAEGMLSDIVDQTLLELLASGEPARANHLVDPDSHRVGDA